MGEFSFEWKNVFYVVHTGEIVSGVVTNVFRDSVAIDIGLDNDAVFPSIKFGEKYTTGENIDVKVVNENGGKGIVYVEPIRVTNPQFVLNNIRIFFHGEYFLEKSYIEYSDIQKYILGIVKDFIFKISNQNIVCNELHFCGDVILEKNQITSIPGYIIYYDGYRWSVGKVEFNESVEIRVFSQKENFSELNGLIKEIELSNCQLNIRIPLNRFLEGCDDDYV